MKTGAYVLSSLLLTIFIVVSAFWFTDIGQHPAEEKTSGSVVNTARERAAAADQAGGGVSIRLRPFSGAYADRFFAELGFTPQQAHTIRKLGCLFQVKIENQSAPTPLQGRLQEWIIQAGADQYAPWTPRVWRRYLPRLNLSAVAHLGFENALLPEDWELPSGGRVEGVVGFALPPGKTFTLIARHRVIRDQGPMQASALRFDDLTCPSLAKGR